MELINKTSFAKQPGNLIFLTNTIRDNFVTSGSNIPLSRCQSCFYKRPSIIPILLRIRFSLETESFWVQVWFRLFRYSLAEMVRVVQVVESTGILLSCLIWFSRCLTTPIWTSVYVFFRIASGTTENLFPFFHCLLFSGDHVSLLSQSNTHNKDGIEILANVIT